MLPSLKRPPYLVSDLMLGLVILAHILITYGLHRRIDSAVPFDISGTALAYLTTGLVLSLLLILLALVKRVINTRRYGNAYGFLNLGYAKGLLVFVALGYLLGSFSVFKVMMSEMLPFVWDSQLAQLDRLIHGRDPWLFLTFLDPYYAPIAFIYSVLWHLVVMVASFAVCVSDLRLRFRYLWTFVAILILGGNLMPMALMAGGPIFYERLTGDRDFAALSDRLYGLANPDMAASLLPDLLWQSYATKTPFVGSGISAFPSIHVALSTLLFLAAMAHSRWLGLIAAGFLVFTLIGSVHLGWHYAVDGYASILMVGGLWFLFGQVEQRARQRPLTPG